MCLRNFKRPFISPAYYYEPNISAQAIKYYLECALKIEGKSNSNDVELQPYGMVDNAKHGPSKIIYKLFRYLSKKGLTHIGNKFASSCKEVSSF